MWETFLPEVLDLWERYFDDERSKDVRIVAKGGETIRVHGIVLACLSDAFRAMLDTEMVEGRTRTVQLKEFTRVQLQFFFRLAYTGQVDPADWSSSQSSSRSSTPKGIGKTDRRRSWRYSSDDYSSEESTSENEWTRKVKGNGKGKGKPVVLPPLELLFGGAILSKQYGVTGFLQKMVAKIKGRLCDANFDEVSRFAIENDIAPLRVKCLSFAEASHRVREDFYNDKLSPPVAFELQALWQPPDDRCRKRKLFF